MILHLGECALTLFLLVIPLIVVYKIWWIPLHLQRLLEFQGIKGPPYKLLHGNTKEIIEMKQQTTDPATDISHDIFPRTQPHLYSWTKLYGSNFLNWDGTKPEIIVTEPELIKEILRNKNGTYLKTIEGYAKKLVGEGIAVAEGEKWWRLRKVADHAFHGECLKDIVPSMITCVETMLKKWMSHEGREIEVRNEFKLLTSEVISRTAFGSSYLEGRKIFDMFPKLSLLISKQMFKLKIFGLRDDIEADQIEQMLQDSIMEIVKKRQEEVRTGQAKSHANDFLGTLVKDHEEIDLAPATVTCEYKIDSNHSSNKTAARFTRPMAILWQ